MVPVSCRITFYRDASFSWSGEWRRSPRRESVPRVRKKAPGVVPRSKLTACETPRRDLGNSFLFMLWDCETRRLISPSLSLPSELERKPLMLWQISPRKQGRGEKKRTTNEALLRLGGNNRAQTTMCCSSTQPSADQGAAAAHWLLHSTKCRLLAPDVAFMLGEKRARAHTLAAYNRERFEATLTACCSTPWWLNPENNTSSLTPAFIHKNRKPDGKITLFNVSVDLAWAKTLK